jgi:hypothetical protein
MYLSILILPLLGSTVSGFMGRKIGVTGAHIITCTCLILSSILATLAFYEVGICGSPVSINLLSWIDSELMFISWEFLFDQLTVSMFIPVLYISSLIHIFSTDYMSEDPHNQRFFSYLSLFTFFMLLLVSGANYFVMFVGWEGNFHCLKWFNNDSIFYNVSSATQSCILFIKNKANLFIMQEYEMRLTFGRSQLPVYIRKFSSNNNTLTSYQRIGPHNLDIISIIIGSTLGDTHLEKRKRGIGTRIIFEQSNKNVEYLMWFHSYFSIRGYCNNQKPKLNKRIRKNGDVFFHYRINTYTFSSFNWIHEMFYKFNELENKLVKIIPNNIEEYLTPLAIAIWFMDGGSKLGKGAKIATNSFTRLELQFLCDILFKKYHIIVTLNSGGKNNGHTLYIHSKSMPLFSKMVKRYMLPSLHYKLGDY